MIARLDLEPSRNRTACLRAMCLALCGASITALTGCSSIDAAGSVQLSSVGTTPLVLDQPFSTGTYSALGSDSEFWFATVDQELISDDAAAAGLADAVFLHAQLLWIPEPGKTPIASTATNLVTRVIVLSGGELGVYGGAAFAEPLDAIGSSELSIRIRGGTLTLLERTEGFRDLLSPSVLEGTLTARAATEETAVWKRAISQLVTNKLGRSTLVDADAPGLPAVATAR
ncbi:MAG: hypothetical protein RL136_97 [Planctomycetota bacterium]|jgi:hypothetical protein